MFKPSGFNVNNGNNVNQGKTWSLSPRPIQEMAADELLVWWLASPCVFFFFCRSLEWKKKEGIEKRGMNNTVHSVNVQHVKVSLWKGKEIVDVHVGKYFHHLSLNWGCSMITAAVCSNFA